MKTSKALTAGEPENNHELLVVGLGASAGGILALKDFFQHVQPDAAIAYVVILHLSPDYDSQLTAVLQAVTSLKVAQVNTRIKLQGNHVYVVSPNQHLSISDGFLEPSDNILMEDRRAPVDIFFRTLAESYRSNAVCVVLSGTGANGSMGLKRVKEQGGAAFVQNPREAEFNEMPRHAIATELVDEVLPVAKIPETILKYKQSLGTIHIPLDADKRPDEQQQALREIFTQLRVRTGHDFSNYKRPTLLRRIERRINVRHLPDLPAYASYLQQNHDEITALLKDLLISVTNFFRDKKTFEIIETEILPELIESKGAGEQVRIWVAGCATGEEAYSIAMLCAEKTLSVIDAPKIQIFATDIDETAIAHARDGIYSINDTADVSPERLRRFFLKEGEGYRVRREIREMILFANHNFIKDPPFSHIDMVSCRNVLIYLNNTAKERVMETFHFALNPGAVLFLGSSESIEGASDLYTILSREHHVFKSRHVGTRAYPVPESVPSLRYEELKANASIQEKEQRNFDRITFGELHQRMLEQYAPPSIIVNEEYDIVHLSERAGQYLQIAGGEPSQNILKLIRQELRLELRSALYQAMQRQAAIETRALKVSVEEHTETLNIHVRPVLRQDDVARGFILIIFERASVDNGDADILLTSDEPVARHLEEELIRLKAQLRASIEQHEFHAEELKASNEELQAMNEELRSAAEELETSKEELQSINEELRTVNQELKVKIEETTLYSNNLQNLINSVDLGTIFLDRSFRVALFTPAVRKIFNLIPADHGRPLSDITHRLDYKNVLHDAEDVLDKLTVIEREVLSVDGQVYMMRILPYRTAEDHINGVVITFVDLTERKRAEDRLHASEEQLKLAVAAGDVGTWVWEIVQDNFIADHQLSDLFAIDPEAAAKGLPSEIVIAGIYKDDRDRIRELLTIVIKDASEIVEEFRVVTRHQQLRWVRIRGKVERNAEGAAIRMAGALTDITERKKSEEALTETYLQLKMATETTGAGFGRWNFLTGVAEWDDHGKEVIGFAAEEEATSVDGWFKRIHPDDLEKVQAHIAECINNSKDFDLQYRVVKAGGETRLIKANGRFQKEDDGTLLKGTSLVIDITEAALAQKKLRESEAFKTFLVQLSDALQGITEEERIMAIAAEQLGKHVNADRVGYAEMDGQAVTFTVDNDWVSGKVNTLKGQYRLEDFGQLTNEFLAGKTVIINDAFNHPLTGSDQATTTFTQAAIGAGVGIPLFTEEHFAAIFFVHQKDQREWSMSEISTINETAIRTWEAIKKARIEEALRRSEERYRLLFESIDEGFCIIEILLDENGQPNDYRFLVVNPAFEKQTGLRNAEGKNMRGIVPGHEDEWFRLYGEIALTGEAKRFEQQAKELNRYYDVYAFPIGKPEERRVGVLFNDISVRKNAEELLKISEERYRVALKSAAMAAWDWDVENDKVVWNDQHYLLLGLEPVTEEKSVKDFLQYVHPDDRAEVSSALQKAINKTGLYHKEFKVITSDGQVRWMNGYGRAFKPEDGHAKRMVGVMFDITRSKELEKQKDEFMGIASHELKTPVTSIKVYTEVLMENFEKSGDAKSASLLYKMNSQVDRLTDLIRALLDNTRIFEGQLFLTPEDFDLNKLIEEKLEEMQRLSGTHRIVLHAGIIETIRADRERIRQVLTNLLSNAIKYSPDGGDVIITTKPVEDGVDVSIADHGVGIPEEVREKVFDRFFRVTHAQINTFPGMGLGLYITAGIVQQHGGRIWVESQPGKGSVFHFTLPYHK